MLKDDQRKVINTFVQVMTCLQFYQRGMEIKSFCYGCLPVFFRYDGLLVVVIVVTPLTAIMKTRYTLCFIRLFYYCLAALLIILGPTRQHKNCYRTGPDSPHFARVRPRLTSIQGHRYSFFIITDVSLLVNYMLILIVSCFYLLLS